MFLDTSKEVIQLATKEQTDDAIARVKASASRASASDIEIVKRAAQQAGSTGNKARDALQGK